MFIAYIGMQYFAVCTEKFELYAFSLLKDWLALEYDAQLSIIIIELNTQDSGIGSSLPEDTDGEKKVGVIIS